MPPLPVGEHRLDGVHLGIGPVYGAGRHLEVDGQSLGSLDAVVYDGLPLGPVEPRRLDLGVRAGVGKVHDADLRVDGHGGGVLQVALDHRSPVAPVAGSHDHLALLVAVHLRPVEVLGDPVERHGSALAAVGLHDDLRVPYPRLRVHRRVRDEGALDHLLARVHPVHDHVLGVEVQGLDAGLVLYDVVEGAVGEVLAADVGTRGEHETGRNVVFTDLGEEERRMDHWNNRPRDQLADMSKLKTD